MYVLSTNISSVGLFEPLYEKFAQHKLPIPMYKIKVHCIQTFGMYCSYCEIKYTFLFLQETI